MFPLSLISNFRMDIFTFATPEATNIQRMVFEDLPVPEVCASPDGTLPLQVFHTVPNRVTEGATIFFSAITHVPPISSSPVLLLYSLNPRTKLQKEYIHQTLSICLESSSASVTFK